MFLNQDKILHFIAGLLISVSFCFIHVALGLPVTMLIAVLKEVYDHYHSNKHTADWNDFIATIVGGVVGVEEFLIFN